MKFLALDEHEHVAAELRKLAAIQAQQASVAGELAKLEGEAASSVAADGSQILDSGGAVCVKTLDRHAAQAIKRDAAVRLLEHKADELAGLAQQQEGAVEQARE